LFQNSFFMREVRVNRTAFPAFIIYDQDTRDFSNKARQLRKIIIKGTMDNNC
jgi:hypothetical protein